MILFLGRKPVGPVTVFELVGVRELLFIMFAWGGGGGDRGGAWEGDFYYLVEMLNIDAENTNLSHMIKW